MVLLMAIENDGDYTNGIQIAHPIHVKAHGLNVNFNQSAFNFRDDPAVQYGTAVLSGNTLYSPPALPSPSQTKPSAVCIAKSVIERSVATALKAPDVR